MTKHFNLKQMQKSSFFLDIGRIFALIAAVVSIPVLAHLAVENSKGDGMQNYGNHDGQDHGKISTVPDNGPGVLILAGFIGAVGRGEIGGRF
jgi:hypothetical protein